MLNSKQLLELTGISRATLNNYIGWGLVPKPEVLPPEPNQGAAPRIGYFPDDVVARIAEVQRLKKDGWSMTRIAEHLAGPQGAPRAPAAVVQPAAAAAKDGSHRPPMPTLSLADIAHPAYVVNRRFELAWFNEAAAADVLASGPGDGAGTNIFAYLLHGAVVDASAREQLVRFHLGLARQEGASFSAVCRGLTAEDQTALARLHGQAPALEPGLVCHVRLSSGAPGAAAVCVYAVQFREGVLFAHVPAAASADLRAVGVEADLVPGDAARRTVPELSPVAVLVADLHCPTRIWSELPAEEYFELINQIWEKVDPIVRRHAGTQGKHAGDGIVCYFFPRPGSHYVWNALAAAQEIRDAMRRVSKEWQLRKGWTTELYMNTGIDEGQQWLGPLKSAGHFEFTMRGDTLNRAARISDFATVGAVWATKNLMAKLTPQEKRRLKFGVRRKNREGREVFVPAIFSSVEHLAEPGAAPSERLKDIARLPITEIVEVDPRHERRHLASDEPPIRPGDIV